MSGQSTLKITNNAPNLVSKLVPRNTEYGNRIEESFEQVKIKYHNINGIKGNRTKLQKLIDFDIEENLDILGITETNINAKEAVFFEVNWQHYKAFWTKDNIEKRKSSGVGLLVRKEWQTHLTKIIVKDSYALKAVFKFKRTILVIW